MTHLNSALLRALGADYAPIIASAGDNKGVILAVLVLVVVLIVVGLSMSSRKSAESTQDKTPEAEPEQTKAYDKPTRELLQDRPELTAQEYDELQRKKEAGELTMAESKILSRAVVVDKKERKTSRENAVEATRRSREEHGKIKVEEPSKSSKPKDEAVEDAATSGKGKGKGKDKDKDKDKDKGKDQEAPQAVASPPTQVEEPPKPLEPTSLAEVSTVDDAWGDLASEVEEDGAPSSSDVAAVEPPAAAAKTEPKADAKTDVKTDAKTEAKTDAKAEPKPEEATARAEVAAQAEAKLARAKAPERPREEVEDGRSVVEGLERTRKNGFGARFKSLFQGEKISDKLLEEIEEFLYTADIGSKAADEITRAIDEQVQAEDKRDPAAVWEFVRGYVLQMLKRHEEPLDIEAHRTFIMLVIGVNGAGKTTTIGKMASQFKRQGKRVLLVAGDTFRAAAVEQLEVWAQRADIPLHKGESEADPASVVFDGITRGVEEGVDIVICDTSGRLHTKANLMDELRKIGRVTGKALPGAPHETILVLDANTGQNAIQQAKTFGEVLDITGIVLTKLDGTARGGVILGIGKELDVPVRYIGIGEGINDLRPFKADEFAEALFL